MTTMDCLSFFKKHEQEMGMQVHVPKGQVIGYTDKPPEWFGFISKGFGATFELLYDQAGQLEEIAYYHPNTPGDVIFAEALFPSSNLTVPVGIEAATDMTILAIDLALARQKARHDSRFKEELLRLFTYTLYNHHNHVLQAKWSILRRVAWLLLTSWRLNPGEEIEAARDDLAAALGQQRSAISRAVSQLENMGLVFNPGTRRSGILVVQDEAGLEAVYNGALEVDHQKQGAEAMPEPLFSIA